MSEKLPFLPFYVNDWETDEKVRSMGPATRGYYLALLIMQWREGSIPSDRRELKRLLQFPRDPMVLAPGVMPEGYTPVDYENDSEYIDLDAILKQCLSCFSPNGNKARLVNPKLELVRKRHLGIRRAKSEGGKVGRLSQLQSMPKHTLGNQNQNQNQNQKERVTPPTPSRGIEVVLPPWIPVEAWAGFLEMRKKIHKPLTERAVQLAIGKLETLKASGNSPLEVLNQSTMNCWQGLFEVKKNGGAYVNRAEQRSAANREACEGALKLAEARDGEAALRSGGSIGGNAYPKAH